jgi:hypothetical protein
MMFLEDFQNDEKEETVCSFCDCQGQTECQAVRSDGVEGPRLVAELNRAR